MRLKKEVWKKIPDFKYYEASSLGRIRSLDRLEARKNRWGKVASYKRIGRILIHDIHGKTKYHYVHIRDLKIKGTMSVHGLVLNAFVGKRPKGFDCAHLDGNKSNNTPSNLKWCSRKENHSHKYIHGTILLGSRHQNSKLTEKQVIEMRELFKNKIKNKPPFYKDIAEKYGIERKTAENILKRLWWTHI